MKRFTEDGYSMEIIREGSKIVVKMELKTSADAEKYLQHLHECLKAGSISINAKFGSLQ